MRGVPQDGVVDVGTLPNRFSRLEEEQPRLNDGGGWITICRIREEGEVGFQR